MFRHCAVIYLMAAAALGSPVASREAVIPDCRLRPRDPAHFHPGLVKLLDSDVREIMTLLGEDAVRLGKGAGSERERLRDMQLAPSEFIRLLSASSETVRDWAIRRMGESGATCEAAIPNLLAIAIDESEGDFPRALAARVLRQQPMAAHTVATLVASLERADSQLRVILLETVAAAGATGKASLKALARYLDAGDAATQFHAFRAIRRIQKSSGESFARVGEDCAKADVLMDLQEKSSPRAIGMSLAILKEDEGGNYLRCVALLGLANQRSRPGVMDVLLGTMANADPFVAEFAGNVLDSIADIDAAAVAALAGGVRQGNEYVRLRSLFRLRALGRDALPAIDTVIGALERAARDGAPAAQVGACLDILRHAGPGAARGSEILVRLLEEDSPIYRNTLKHEVDRLRGFLFVTLAATGVPDNALPAIRGALANGGDLMMYEFTGAARAAGAAGPRAKEAGRHLLRALGRGAATDLVAFQRFDSHAASDREYTSPQIEALRALSRIGITDESTLRAVCAFLKKAPFADAGFAQNVPDPRAEAAKTLTALNANSRP
jgi:hypothetical protein